MKPSIVEVMQFDTNESIGLQIYSH